MFASVVWTKHLAFCFAFTTVLISLSFHDVLASQELARKDDTPDGGSPTNGATKEDLLELDQLLSEIISSYSSAKSTIRGLNNSKRQEKKEEKKKTTAMLKERRRRRREKRAARIEARRQIRKQKIAQRKAKRDAKKESKKESRAMRREQRGPETSEERATRILKHKEKSERSRQRRRMRQAAEKQKRQEARENRKQARLDRKREKKESRSAELTEPKEMGEDQMVQSMTQMPNHFAHIDLHNRVPNFAEEEGFVSNDPAYIAALSQSSSGNGIRADVENALTGDDSGEQNSTLQPLEQDSQQTSSESEAGDAGGALNPENASAYEEELLKADAELDLEEEQDNEEEKADDELERSNELIEEDDNSFDQLQGIDADETEYVAFLKANDYARPRRLCELIEKKKPESFEKSEKTTAEKIFENIKEELLNQVENDDELFEELQSPKICFDSVTFISTRLGVLQEDDSDSDPPHLEASETVMLSSSTAVDKFCTIKQCTRRKDPEGCLVKNNPVSDQGQCGSCWIFGTILAIELNMCQRFGKIHRDISHGHFAQCYGRRVCGGGLMSQVLHIYSTWKTMRYEDEQPYKLPVRPHECMASSKTLENAYDGWEFKTHGKYYKEYSRKYHFKHFVGKNYTKLVTFIKQTVIEHGAIVVVMHMKNVVPPSSPTRRKDFRLPVIRCNYNAQNHLMAITGFGEYVTPSGEKREYYEIRNSWGDWWGDKGYWRLDTMGPKGCNGFVAAYVETMDLNRTKELTDIDHCSARFNDCENDSKCERQDDAKGRGRKCICRGGFTGETCGIYIRKEDNSCQDFPCRGGSCLLVARGVARCKCPNNKSGADCEEENLCKADSCKATEFCSTLGGKVDCVEKEDTDDTDDIGAGGGTISTAGAVFLGVGLLAAAAISGGGYYYRDNVKTYPQKIKDYTKSLFQKGEYEYEYVYEYEDEG